MRVNPFRRSRHARRWWQAPAAELNTEPFAVPAPELESVEIVADVSEFARVLEAGVAATRRRIERPQPDRAHLDRHGPFLRADAVPPPPMPGGAA